MIYVYYLLIILTLLLLMTSISGFIFYNTSIRRSKKEFLQAEDFVQELKEKLNQYIDWLKQQQLESLEIINDGIKLKAKLLKGNNESNTVVILVHGYMSRGDEMAGFARFFYDKYSYDILMPDLRGHGKSEGDYIGFGWHDRLDIIKWIDYVIDHFGKNVQIILFGISMGATTVCMTSGEELPDNVKLIISDCAYDSIENILAYHAKRMYKLPKFPIINITNLYTKCIAGYDIKKGKAYEKVKKSNVPILYIHGGNDDFVPTEMSEHLYNETKSEKNLVIIDKAGHGEAYDTDPHLYENVVDSYIKQYIS